MKKFYFSFLALTLTGTLAFAEDSEITPMTTVYQSDMTDWTFVNNGDGNGWVKARYSLSWLWDEYKSEIESLTGMTNGIGIDSEDYICDDWAISPAIKLEENVAYTISVYVLPQEESFGWLSYEDSWSLCVATAAADFEAGSAKVIYSDGALSGDTLTKVSKEFKPSTSGDYYFAAHCDSEEGYGMGLTAFKVETIDTTASVINVDAEADSVTRYYNLQGVEVANPQHGNLYIVKSGNKASKTIF